MPNVKSIVHLGLDCTETAVSAALSGVCDQLQKFGLSPEDLATTEIVLAEVLNNVVEHACPEMPEHDVELWVEHANKTLQCRVQDHGKPIPNGELPSGNAAAVVDVAFEDLPEGGFGWFLIRALAKDITYERLRGRNILRFELAVSA